MARRYRSDNSVLGIDISNKQPGYFDAIAGVMMAQHIKETAQLAGADLNRAASSQPTGQGDPAWADLGYGNQFISGGTKTVGNTTYNPNYYNNLLAQGHTKDPYTGAAIPGANLKGLTATQMRTAGKANRDLDALHDMMQGPSPQIDIQTGMKALAAIERKHGVDVLMHNKKYLALSGKNEEFEVQKEAAKQARAKQLGVDPGMMGWDDRTGKPVLDEEAITVSTLKQRQQQIEQKPIIEFRKFQEELIDSRLRQELQRADEQVRLAYASEDGQLLVDAQKHRDKVYEQARAERSALRETGGQSTATGEVEAAMTGGQAAPAAALTHPKLPANTRIVGQFSAFSEAASGLQASQYGIIKGRLVRKTNDGRLEEVK